MLRRNREIVIFNLSAIDLFCSGMGAVMVLMVLLMPYYRKEVPIPPPQPPPIAEVAPPPAPAPPKPEPPKPAAPEPEKGIHVRGVDVVFLMDATMSMNEELSAVRSSMTSIVQVLRRLSDEVSVGFVAYIDWSTPWVIPLKPVGKGHQGEENLSQLLKGMSEIQLVGNQDWPEDVCEGLAKATAMNWPTAGERRQIIVLIGDARTHPQDRQRSLDLVTKWAANRKQTRSLHAVFTPPLELTSEPGFDQEMEASSAYFRDVAAAGNGKFHLGQDDLLGNILDILIVR
jgi:hypothetical protein